MSRMLAWSCFACPDDQASWSHESLSWKRSVRFDYRRKLLLTLGCVARATSCYKSGEKRTSMTQILRGYASLLPIDEAA
jgi:hypothetical protein